MLLWCGYIAAVASFFFFLYMMTMACARYTEITQLYRPNFYRYLQIEFCGKEYVKDELFRCLYTNKLYHWWWFLMVYSDILHRCHWSMYSGKDIKWTEYQSPNTEHINNTNSLLAAAHQLRWNRNKDNRIFRRIHTPTPSLIYCCRLFVATFFRSAHHIEI